jgi:hypothetical protein
MAEKFANRTDDRRMHHELASGRASGDQRTGPPRVSPVVAVATVIGFCDERIGFDGETIEEIVADDVVDDRVSMGGDVCRDVGGGDVSGEVKRFMRHESNVLRLQRSPAPREPW